MSLPVSLCVESRHVVVENKVYGKQKGDTRQLKWKEPVFMNLRRNSWREVSVSNSRSEDTI